VSNSAEYADWRDEFVLSRDVRAVGRHSELVGAVRRGSLVPVTRGAFRRVEALETNPHLRADDAFLAVVRATQMLSPIPLVFSGFAAAAVWGLPIIGSWPTRVDVASAPAAGGRSNKMIRRSSLLHPAESVEREGLRVTTLARTVVDVGRTASFSQATAMADSALHGRAATASRPAREPLTLSALLQQLDRFGHAAGTAKCRGIVDFADGESGSPGESLSRAGMKLLGFPAPQLQVPFFDQNGFIGAVDFWWPEFKLIGEFDGNGKYLRDEFAKGRTPAQVVIDEKHRENRLRALGNGMTRWDWSVARSLPALRAHLENAGVRR
jgi:hypothetical protein